MTPWLLNAKEDLPERAHRLPIGSERRGMLRVRAHRHERRKVRECLRWGIDAEDWDLRYDRFT